MGLFSLLQVELDKVFSVATAQIRVHYFVVLDTRGVPFENQRQTPCCESPKRAEIIFGRQWEFLNNGSHKVRRGFNVQDSIVALLFHLVYQLVCHNFVQLLYNFDDGRDPPLRVFVEDLNPLFRL